MRPEFVLEGLQRCPRLQDFPKSIGVPERLNKRPATDGIKLAALAASSLYMQRVAGTPLPRDERARSESTEAVEHASEGLFKPFRSIVGTGGDLASQVCDFVQPHVTTDGGRSGGSGA